MNRLAYTPLPLVSFLETVGFFHAGCAPLDSLVEEGETFCLEYYLDWEILTEPCFAIGHTPTGHYWMPWDEAPRDAETIRKIIRAGYAVSLERCLEEER